MLAEKAECGNSADIRMSKKWLGKKVKVRVEEIRDEEEYRRGYDLLRADIAVTCQVILEVHYKL